MSLTFLDNGIIKLGINDTSWGCVIGYLSPSGSVERNVFTSARMDDGVINQSYWGDPLGSGSEWPWDPIQGGSFNSYYYGNPVVEAFTNNGVDSSYARIRPVQFIDMNGDANPYMVMEQWVELIGAVAKVRFRATYTGPDRSGRQNEFPDETAGGLYGIDGYWNQETPALGVAYAYNHGYIYNGPAPWTSGALTDIGTASYDGNVTKPSEKWIATLANDGWGIGIYAPDSDAFNHLDCTDSIYTTPWTAFNFTNGQTNPVIFEYEIYLTLGTIEEIRSRFYEIHSQNAVSALLQGVSCSTSTGVISGIGINATGSGAFSAISVSTSVAAINGIGLTINSGSGSVTGVIASTSVGTIDGSGSSSNPIRAPNGTPLDLRTIYGDPIIFCKV